MGVLMSEDFPTIDITRMTPEERVLELTGESARPGKICEQSPGFIRKEEAEQIAMKLGISVSELEDAFLREIRAYNTKLYKPKHEAKEIRLGDRLTGAIHKAPHGKCVFLDKKHPDKHECMIEDTMPLHCRIAARGNHSEKLHIWYMLNHAVNPDDPRSLREWAIYLKTHPTIPGGRLKDLVPDDDRLRSILEADDYHIEVQEED